MIIQQNIDIINKKLEQNIIVFCTYQSCKLLQNKTFDLGIFDEAHKTVNNKIFESKKLSMNNSDIYGKTITNYTFGKAIKDKFILDFQIIGYISGPKIYDFVLENI